MSGRYIEIKEVGVVWVAPPYRCCVLFFQACMSSLPASCLGVVLAKTLGVSLVFIVCYFCRVHTVSRVHRQRRSFGSALEDRLALKERYAYLYLSYAGPSLSQSGFVA